MNMNSSFQCTHLLFPPAKKKVERPPKRKGTAIPVVEKKFDDYLRSLDLKLFFTHDAIKSKAPSALPFSSSVREIFNVPDYCAPASRRSVPGILGRHNAVGDVMSHSICQGNYRGTKNDKDFVAKPYALKSVVAEEEMSESTKSKEPMPLWDEFLLTRLTDNTANDIIIKHTTGTQKERLVDKILDGDRMPIDSKTFVEAQHIPVLQLKKKEDLYNIRSETDITEKEATVETEDQVEDKEEKPIPKYLDLGNPVKRDYKFLKKPRRRLTIDDDNNIISSDYHQHKLLENIPPYTDDMLQGKTPVFNLKLRNKIQFDDQTQYEKKLVDCYPNEPKAWGIKHHSFQSSLPTKGALTWKDYPKLIITAYQRNVTLEDSSDEEPVSEHEDPSETGLDRLILNKAITKWKQTCYYDDKARNADIDSLFEDFKCINEHVRITAALSCPTIIGYREDWNTDKPKKEKRHAIEDSFTQKDKEDLLRYLEEGLQDESDKVKRACAVSLVTIGTATDKAVTVLLSTLQRNDMSPGAWAAVQCLAMENVADTLVIEKLIVMTHSIDALTHITAIKLLIRLSAHTDKVLFLVSNELNSKMWRHRYMACKVIQRIFTPLNNDVIHKLLTMMWSDFEPVNRRIAAQTIGLKDYAHILHEELYRRLKSPGEKVRIDALKRIISLDMMTLKLKSLFLECFKDDYVSVRYTAAKGAGELKFKDEDVTRGLLDIISDDYSDKVKAAAIEALSLIGLVNDEIVEKLVWSTQYQHTPKLRAAACLALALLKVNTEEVVMVLRDRLTADSDLSVRKVTTNALKMLGIKPEKDATLILAVRKAVQELGTKEAIIRSIFKDYKGPK